MSKIEIDFNNLKYNLYEILNVSPDSDDVKIKKNFVKLIKNFHPDKNSDLEEEIYYHIILANQILLNKDSRKKYNDFLNGVAESFQDLKNSFSKSIKNVDQYFPHKDDSQALFNNKIEELNKKHSYSENVNSESVVDKFNKAKEKRSGEDIKIEKEDFKTVDEFNDKFNTYKTDGGKFQDQIIEFKGAPTELSTYVIGENYTSLQDLDKLYIEDSVQSSRYSSLDKAFMLQPSTNTLSTPKTAEERMKEYQSQTDLFKNMKPTEFSTKKFNEWD